LFIKDEVFSYSKSVYISFDIFKETLKFIQDVVMFMAVEETLKVVEVTLRFIDVEETLEVYTGYIQGHGCRRES
jgi:hypothetical protein